jgi:hypothetical protein
MSMSVIHYDPVAQSVKNLRAVFKIPKGVAAIPGTIKVLDIKIQPKDAQGNDVVCYFPANAGIWSAVRQIELLVGDKPVDLFLSKQASAFVNTLGNPDLQKDIAQPLSASNNVVYETPESPASMTLQYQPVDAISQALELRKVLDYLNRRYIVEDGLSVSITWDKDVFNEWLLDQSAAVSTIDIFPGYLSYESIEGPHKFPEQKTVAFHQTIQETILVPSIGYGEIQYWEQRMNSLRGKTVTRALFAVEPEGAPANTTAVRGTFGKLCSVGQLGESLNIAVDGSQILTFKGFSSLAHKLAMTSDSWGVSSAAQGAWYLGETPSLRDSKNQGLVNYFSYLGVDMNRFVDKEVVIQYQRKSADILYPAQAAALKVHMISQVLKTHDLATGVCTYVRI